MVQGNWHFTTVREAINMLEVLFLNKPQTGILSDLHVFWARGDPHRRRAPDVIVLPDVDEPRRPRRSLRLWEERSWPTFVLEVLSDKTEEEDLGGKFLDYQDIIGIAEYFICDPWQVPMELSGNRLTEEGYVAIEPAGNGRLWSESLNAWLGIDDRGLFRIWDAAGRPLPTIEEVALQAQAEAERADREARRAREEERLRADAEERIRQLEAELRRRGG